MKRTGTLIGFIVLSILSIAQKVEFIAVCDKETEKIVVIQAKDLEGNNYEILRRNFPNSKVANAWIDGEYSSRNCSQQKQKIKPGIPSDAKAGETDKTIDTPKKKVKHFYRNRYMLSYGLTRFNLEGLPGFTAEVDGGVYYMFRFQNGDRVQLRTSLLYNNYGTVQSFNPDNDPVLEWDNVKAQMGFCVPIDLVKNRGKVWLLPFVDVGVSWQNLREAKSSNFDINPEGGGWFLNYGTGFEFYHINLNFSSYNFMMPAIEEKDFKFKGLMLGIGLSF